MNQTNINPLLTTNEIICATIVVTQRRERKNLALIIWRNWARKYLCGDDTSAQSARYAARATRHFVARLAATAAALKQRRAEQGHRDSAIARQLAVSAIADLGITGNCLYKTIADLA